MKEKYKQPYKPVDLPQEKSTFFHLNCPSCNSGIPANDINITDKLAKCGSCNALFSFEDQLMQLEPDIEQVKKPVGVEKTFLNNELEISVPEPVRGIYQMILALVPIFILLFSLLYFKNGAIWAGYSSAFLSIILAYTIYSIFGSKKNKVFFNTNKNLLTVDWIENSLKKPVTIPIDEIEQIYTSRTAKGVSLIAVLNTTEGQKHKTLITGLKSVLIAKYVEQEIENHLGISNKKVSNEVQ